MPCKLDHILIIDVEATCWQGDPLEGLHHSAGDDAWNIAAILAEVLRRARIAGRLAAPITTAIGV